MAQRKGLYYAKCVELLRKNDTRFREYSLNKTGLLAIYVSEKKYPGKSFIVFLVEENGFRIKTSCGELIHVANTIEIDTLNGSKYKFEIIE